ncbi:MAG TPA: helix-turn-helix domain-containing protein [Streptosporangiaceae bacterium]
MVGSPDRRLRPWLPRGYTGVGESVAPHRLVLSASVAVPLITRVADSAYRPPVFVLGGHGAHAVMEGDCAPAYLEVWLSPLGAYSLLGAPPDELTGQLVDAASLFGAAARRLAERIREAATWRQRFEVMDEFLLRRLALGPQPAPEVAYAWRRLVAAGGSVAIGEIADEVGWSHKHLIARFKRQVGLAPKAAARVIRFDRVSRYVAQHRDVPLGELAFDFGYADQAHMSRDFKSFSGTTLTGFLDRAAT